jgi:hypothetical protein
MMQKANAQAEAAMKPMMAKPEKSRADRGAEVGGSA